MRLRREKIHPLSLKPANKPVCPKCKTHYWYVSQRVISRLLNCPDCRHSFWYKRELDNTYELHNVGRFKSAAELERRVSDYAQDFN